jgi:hypothetical protein
METKTSVIWGAMYFRVLPVIAALATSACFPVPAEATNVSAPSAVYNPDLDRIDVFVTGDDGQLYDNYWDGSAWQWANLGVPLGANAVRNPSAVYHPTLHSMFVFVIGDNGHLFEWNGVVRQWYDRGKTYPGASLSPPSAVYRSATNQILVFVVTDNEFLDYWNGSAWNFTSGEGLAVPVSQPSAIAQTDIDRVVVFTTEIFNNSSYLRDTFWNGSGWFTQNDSPPDPINLGPPSAVYTGLDFAFATGDNGQLYDRHWNGVQWVWERLYNPGPNVSSPSAVYWHFDWFFSQISVFVIGDDGHLYNKYTTDFGWVWEDQQTPSDGVSVVAPLSAIVQPLNRIHVFVAGTDGQLWLKYYDGAWKWQNQGTPQ